MEGERYRVHSSQQQLRHIPQDGRGRQLFLEQEVGQVRPRFHVLLRPSLAPHGYLGLSPLHVLLGCVGGRCREASLPLDGFPSSHPCFTSVVCASPNANIWSQSWQRRPQGPGTRRCSQLGIAMVNSVDTNTDPTARMKVSVSGGTSVSRQPRREPSSTAAMPGREGALSGHGRPHLHPTPSTVLVLTF